jgi:hypothetical protein
MNLTVAGDMVDLSGTFGTITLVGADLYPAPPYGTVERLGVWNQHRQHHCSRHVVGYG